MPLYEYHCDDCDKTFEVIKKFSDPVEEPCEYCGSANTHKLVSAPSVRFKGTGWYVNDYGGGHSAIGGSAGDNPKKEKGADAPAPACEACAAAGSCPASGDSK